MKRNLFLLVGMVVTMVGFAQGFSGTYSLQSKEMISGIEYLNAIPQEITVTMMKDSIKITRVTPAGDGGTTTSNETLALNNKSIITITGSKRTKTSTISLDKDGNALTIITTFSYPEKPKEIEFKNTEVWVLDEGNLTIVKTSDATVTDDWVIKGVFKRI